MARRTLDLFPETKPPRSKRRIMMHMVDSGDAGSGWDSHFICEKCGHDGGWLPVTSVSDSLRGRPCPKCNHPTSDKE